MIYFIGTADYSGVFIYECCTESFVVHFLVVQRTYSLTIWIFVLDLNKQCGVVLYYNKIHLAMDAVQSTGQIFFIGFTFEKKKRRKNAGGMLNDRIYSVFIWFYGFYLQKKAIKDSGFDRN